MAQNQPKPKWVAKAVAKAQFIQPGHYTFAISRGHQFAFSGYFETPQAAYEAMLRTAAARATNGQAVLLNPDNTFLSYIYREEI